MARQPDTMHLPDNLSEAGNLVVAMFDKACDVTHPLMQESLPWGR